jgi:hypothetical protein
LPPEYEAEVSSLFALNVDAHYAGEAERGVTFSYCNSCGQLVRKSTLLAAQEWRSVARVTSQTAFKPAFRLHVTSLQGQKQTSSCTLDGGGLNMQHTLLDMPEISERL